MLCAVVEFMYGIVCIVAVRRNVLRYEFNLRGVCVLCCDGCGIVALRADAGGSVSVESM